MGGKREKDPQKINETCIIVCILQIAHLHMNASKLLRHPLLNTIVAHAQPGRGLALNREAWQPGLQTGRADDAKWGLAPRFLVLTPGPCHAPKREHGPPSVKGFVCWPKCHTTSAARRCSQICPKRPRKSKNLGQSFAVIFGRGGRAHPLYTPQNPLGLLRAQAAAPPRALAALSAISFMMQPSPQRSF